MTQADPIAEEAYREWELREFALAAELFMRASVVENVEAGGRSQWATPDQSVLYRLRAGFCLFEDGQFSKAFELLQEGLDFDWKGARHWANRYDAERCHSCFILYYANKGDLARYESHVTNATKDGQRLGIEFPWSLPVKEQAIKAALAMDDLRNLTLWAAAIDAKARQEIPELGLLCTLAEKATRGKELS